jgi:hypothetical protein
MWVVAVPNRTTARRDFAPAHLRVTSLADVMLADLAKQFAESEARPAERA